MSLLVVSFLIIGIWSTPGKSYAAKIKCSALETSYSVDTLVTSGYAYCQTMGSGQCATSDGGEMSYEYIFHPSSADQDQKGTCELTLSGAVQGVQQIQSN